MHQNGNKDRRLHVLHQRLLPHADADDHSHTNLRYLWVYNQIHDQDTSLLDEGDGIQMNSKGAWFFVSFFCIYLVWKVVHYNRREFLYSFFFWKEWKEISSFYNELIGSSLKSIILIAWYTGSVVR